LFLRIEESKFSIVLSYLPFLICGGFECANSYCTIIFGNFIWLNVVNFIAVNYWAYCRKEKKHLQPLISATRNLRYVLHEKVNGREVWDLSFLLFHFLGMDALCREDSAPSTFLGHPILTNKQSPYF